MEKEKLYHVRKLKAKKEYHIEVPGSKSITNRALLLAALSGKKCMLSGVLFSDDTRGFLDCLVQLGFSLTIEEEKKQVILQGTAGQIPNPRASIDVRSAGTAARFLTVALAFAQGIYELDASLQMRKRPMEPILKILENLGVQFEFGKEPYHFPFKMIAVKEPQNTDVSAETLTPEITIDTGLSSQFASALLMAACVLPNGLQIYLTGTRTEGSYIKMTLVMMEQFGIRVEQINGADGMIGYRIEHQADWGLEQYQIEPDVSAACYFYAMSPLLKTSVIVRGVHKNSMQGDIQFLQVLEQMGCESKETEEGIQISFPKDVQEQFRGVTVSMKDFSDQTMTLAALAPFANTPTTIRNIGHIRFQESDRLHAVLTELKRMNVRCEEVVQEDGIRIEPIDKPEVLTEQIEIETYEDHRMAMAFTLPGLVLGNIEIKNPQCCGKTFENYFEVIESLYGEE